MLHRSFKPAKCKTALKLAVSRIKLLNNKREVQIKQIKKELAQLLESGQIQTARIRVEHVVREEKTLTAYNLVEIYCELIAARLPIIESQKNCPIDLKEAVTSVLYACSRCSDVPELAEIKKHLKAKYGKEFVTAAIEVRPDCGVNRMLVEKLAVKAPDGPTKLKILTAIAEEHNVKWDPDSFSGSDTKPEDLLSGPNNFEMASKLQTEAPPGHVQPGYDNRGPPNIQVPAKHSERNDAFVNASEENMRRSSGSQSFASIGVGPNNEIPSGASHSVEKSSGTRTERMEHRQSYVRTENASYGRQDWGMQFKDATSAAQAAAESAEIASMAARAAAELSRQQSSESLKPHGYTSKEESRTSYGYVPKDESPQIHTGPKVQSDLVEKAAELNSFPGRHSERHNKHIVDKVQDELSRPSERLVRDVHRNNDRDSKEDPLKSTTASADGASSTNSFKGADGYSQKKYYKSYESEFSDEACKKSQSSDSDLKTGATVQDSVKSEEVYYVDLRVNRKQSSSGSHHSRHSHSNSSSSRDDKEEFSRKNNSVTYAEETRTKQQPSRASSCSHSSSSDDIHEDIFKRNEQSEDSFVHDDSGIYRHTLEMNSKENSARFDNYASDNDHNKVDLMSYKEQETSLRFSPPSGKASIGLLANSTVWSPRRSTDEGRRSPPQFHPSVYSESSEVSCLPSQPDHFPAASYDDYESPSSDREEDERKSELPETTHLREVPSVKVIPFNSEDRNSEDENAEPRRKFMPSSTDPAEKVVPRSRRQGIISRPVSGKKFHDDVVQTDEPPSRITQSRLEWTELITEEVYDFSKDSELLSDSSSGSGSELKFGSLKGGLRNKGVRHPPYTRKPSEKFLVVKGKTEDNRSDEQSPSHSPTVKSLVDPSGSNEETYRERSSLKQSKKASMRNFARRVDSDDDNLEEEPQQDTRINRPSFNLKSGIKPNRKPSSRSPCTYVDSDDSDTEEEVSQLNSPANVPPRSAFSRRTKASSPIHGRAHLKTTEVLSEESVTSNYRSENKSHSSSSHGSDRLPKTSGRSYSKPAISSSEKTATPAYGVERESFSSRSNVSEPQPKTTTIRPYSKTTGASKQSGIASYEPESKSSSRSIPKDTVTTYSKINVSSGESAEPDYGFKSKSLSTSSNVDEISQKTTGREYLSTNVPVRESATPGYGAESKSSFGRSRVSESMGKPLTDNKSSTGTREQPRPVQLGSPKPILESRRSSHMDSSKSSTSEQKSKSPPKSAKSNSSEALKLPSVSRELSMKDKASHVHPNLPDSDAFTAFFQARKQPRE